jgi:pre-mRNA-processing factor 6
MSGYPSAPRTDFGKPPPGYIPGVGRGAVGFTTRSDIGPAKPAVESRGRAGAAATAQQYGAAPPPGFKGSMSDVKKEKEADYSESQFDNFSGYQEALFANSSLDAEDKEAELIYEAIDRHMDSRRRKRREETEHEELLKHRKKRPKIAEQLRDLKAGLATVTDDEWANIPEPLDYSRQNKLMKRREDRFTAVPDNVLASAHAMATGTAYNASVVVDTPGAATPASSTAPVDLTMLGKVRDKQLSNKLDRMADSVKGQTVVDPKGYLTEMSSMRVSSDAEVSDIKKARLLLNSVITTNPNHGPGWIAAARLEAEVGKLATAREVIMKGCKLCPKDEDVWLEAARLAAASAAKTVLAKAVRNIPKSVRIWVAAAELEHELPAKRAVLRRALDVIPDSERLWKEAVEHEEPDDARVMLGRAVECVPGSVDLWLALARLETYRNAQKVLNRARAKNPAEPSIWISAAKLEEANGKEANIEKVIKAAVKSLAANNVIISREAWLKEAENAERSEAIKTCQALIHTTIGISVETPDRRATWINDAQTFLDNGSIHCARATYAHLLSAFPSHASIWRRAANVEKKHGNVEDLHALLAKAVEYCPQSEELWLYYATDRWRRGDFKGARKVLNDAFMANSESEDIWVTAIRLEQEKQQFKRASNLLERARSMCDTPRVWMKSAVLERQMGNHDTELKLIETALGKFPKYDKLWIMLGQYYTNKQPQPDLAKARESFRNGVRQCPQSVNLWLCYAGLDIHFTRQFARARATLETARVKVPKNPHLWLESIRVEQRAQNAKLFKQLLSKSLQECPDAGILWAHAVASDPQQGRKRRSFDALSRCKDDPHVFLAVAKLFWNDGKVKRARDWFERCVAANALLGDSWAFFYKFEQEHGTEELQQKLMRRCADARPTHGDLWTSVSKRMNTPMVLSPGEILQQAAARIKQPFELWYGQEQ